ncbi:uncharacterized protein PG986_005116 [Apiospora aurea]|uniref:Uncharacterized protein n=1 Tax=Apiospora aurea TaxID=335848 RepID=A0ABR1QGN0_9PEZI
MYRWLCHFWARRNASVQTINSRFGAIAGATTNQIRLDFLRGSGATDRVEGTALRQRSIETTMIGSLRVPR